MYGYVRLLNKICLKHGKKATEMRHCDKSKQQMKKNTVNHAPNKYSLLENHRRNLRKYIIVKLIVIMIKCSTSHSCVSGFVPLLFYYFSCTDSYC